MNKLRRSCFHSAYVFLPVYKPRNKLGRHPSQASSHSATCFRYRRCHDTIHCLQGGRRPASRLGQRFDPRALVH